MNINFSKIKKIFILFSISLPLYCFKKFWPAMPKRISDLALRKRRLETPGLLPNDINNNGAVVLLYRSRGEKKLRNIKFRVIKCYWKSRQFHWPEAPPFIQRAGIVLYAKFESTIIINNEQILFVRVIPKMCKIEK